MSLYRPAGLLSLAGIIACLLLPALFPAQAFSQDPDGTPEKLTHWLTPEEMTRLHEIGKAFVETDPPAAPVRNIAEFDYMQGVLVRYPFGIPIALIKEMAEDVVVTTIVANAGQQTTVLNQYIANGVDTSHCDFLIAGSNSYWTRDYGPWFVSDSSRQIGIVDFPYNRPRPLDDEIPKLLANQLGIPWFGMNVIHTGGNYMTDGHGISASTTLVWEENPSQTHEEIDEKMQAYLGIETYHVLPDPNGTYIDHIDCWGKFLAPDKILIRAVPSYHPRYQALENMAGYWETQTCSYGYPYHVIRVNTPGDQPYSNSLILNNKVLIPFMNSTWDDSARAVYEAAMPGYEVIGILGLGSAPWESTDALHCRTKGIADVGQLFISHIPLSGNKPCEEDYVVEADIIACSKQPVIADSVLIRYQVDGGAFQQAGMINTGGEHWTGVIPAQPAGSTVCYYLTAADESGRHASCPLIGAADPFCFSTVYTNITAIPDTLWFLTPEDCVEGKVTMLNNFTQWPILVNWIETEGNQGPFYWYVPDPPATPFSLGSGQTDSLRVYVLLPLDGLTGYYLDTLSIATAVDTIRVILIADSMLFTARNELASAPDRLGNSYPTPVSGETTIPVTLSGSGKVTLEILTLNGSVVTTLADAFLSAGIHRFTWNTASPAAVPGGIYLVRMTTSQGVEVKRIVVIR